MLKKVVIIVEPPFRRQTESVNTTLAVGQYVEVLPTVSFSNGQTGSLFFMANRQLKVNN